MENNKNLILGLDLGVASIGWALISEQNDEKIFLDAGVKIFQEPVEAKSRAPKNHARRDARGIRRNLKRKVRRKVLLKKTLLKAGLTFSENFTKNMYKLRASALDEKLQMDDLAAVLYHFGQKRGFLSNAKGKTKEDGDVKKSISSIAENMEKFGARTLGEYRYFLMKQREDAGLPAQKFVEKYTSRVMYRDELTKIWEKQAEFYPAILTPELKNEIFYHIFYQRPLKLQKDLVGSCSYFPDRKRAERASLIVQEFLVWKQVSDLKYMQKGSTDMIEISFGDKKKLVEILMEQGSLSFGKVKKILGLTDDVVFNLEKNTNKKGLEGNKTNSLLEGFLKVSDNFVNGTIFLPENTDKNTIKYMLLQDILTIHVDEYLTKRLENFWKISEKGVQEILKMKQATLPKGYVNYSEKAIKKILEVMRETGENDRKIIEDLRRAGKFPAEKNVYANMKDPWQELPTLRNPSVMKAIVEARKVIKAVKNVYGMPTLVRIEMTSDLKNSKKERDEISKKQKNLEKENTHAREMIAEQNQTATRERMLLVRLWEECGGTCPYTGRSISLPQLIEGGSGFDIEHIIPYSRCLDDSFANKTLCYADFNRNIKKQKTPQELKNADFSVYEKEEKWSFDAMMNFVKNHLPKNKLKKFEMQHVDTDEFIARQLNDTRYICQEIRSFCEALIGKNCVQITKGRLTAMLRHAWNFNHFLPESEETKTDEKNSSKKDRTDHRHHAIDAIVVALTSQNLLQKASIQSRNNELRFKVGDERMDTILRVYNQFSPGEIFRSDVEKKLDSMIISHTSVHKIRDSLHEETAFGKIFDKESQQEVFVVRKGVETLKIKNLENVVDVEVQKILKEYFDKNGSYSAENPPLHKDGKTPIKSVRMKENKSNMYNFRGENEKFFAFGNNHHVEIIEHKTLKNKDGTPKREGIFVTMLEANRRAKQKEKLVNRIGSWKNEIKNKEFSAEEWNFVFSLCNNDMVKYFPNPQNLEEFEICRVMGMSGPDNRFTLKNHISASEGFDFRGTPNGMMIQKIQVDALGNIFPAND